MRPTTGINSFPFPAGVNCKQLLGWLGALCPLPLSAGTLSVLNLCGLEHVASLCPVSLSSCPYQYCCPKNTAFPIPLAQSLCFFFPQIPEMESLTSVAAMGPVCLFLTCQTLYRHDINLLSIKHSLKILPVFCIAFLTFFGVQVNLPRPCTCSASLLNTLKSPASQPVSHLSLFGHRSYTSQAGLELAIQPRGILNSWLLVFFPHIPGTEITEV